MISPVSSADGAPPTHEPNVFSTRAVAGASPRGLVRLLLLLWVCGTTQVLAAESPHPVNAASAPVQASAHTQKPKPIATRRQFEDSTRLRGDTPTLGGDFARAVDLCVSAQGRSSSTCTVRTTQLSLGEPATIVVTDVNPFLYQVRVRVTETVVSEPAARTFLELAFGVKVPDQTVLMVPPGTTEAKDMIPVCNGGVPDQSLTNPAMRPIKQELTRLTCRLRVNADKADKAESDLQTVQAAIAGPSAALLADTTPVATVVRLSRTISASIDSLVTLERTRSPALLSVNASAIGRELGVLRERAATLAAAGSPQPDTLERFIATIDFLRSKAAFLSKRAETLAAAYKTLRGTQAAIDAVLTTPTSFFEFAEIGPYQRATDVTLHIERRKRGDAGAWTEIATRKISFGGGRTFVLGFGTAWSGIVRQTYSAQPFYRAPSVPGGADTIVTRIAIDTRDGGRVAPMLTLDAPLLCWRTCHADWLRLVGGVSYRAGSQALALENLEYMPAIGVSVINNKVMLGAGALIGRQERLRSDLAVNAPIPASQTKIPTERRTQFGLTGFVAVRFP
jgi:hypothetical protein